MLTAILDKELRISSRQRRSYVLRFAYVAVLAGYGGANPIWGGPMADIAKDVPRGGTLYVFALDRN